MRILVIFMSKNKIASVILLLIGLLLLMGFLQKDNEIKPTKPTLQSTVEQSMAGSSGRYGIVIKNFKSGESYRLNEHQIFEAGSLYKLWVAASAYQQLQAGGFAEDDLLSEDVAVLNEKFNIAPEDAELTEGTMQLTVSQALNQMITLSHNYAALLLTEKVKLSSVAAFLKENGFTQSQLGIDDQPLKVTPSDIALFYEKLYKEEFINQEYTNKMIGLLKDQKLNDGLAKYLPDQLQVASKTGDIGWFKHDAGIVYSPAGDYLIVVLSESDYPPGAQERIALLSKAVFDYFNRIPLLSSYLIQGYLG